MTEEQHETAFRFRVRFSIPQDCYIDFDGQELEITTDCTTTLKVKAIGADTIKDTKNLVITGGPYESVEEAETEGKRAVAALLITAAAMRIGIDLGRDAPGGGLTRAGRDHFSRQLGAEAVNDVPGLTVYDASSKKVFIGFGVKAVRGLSGKNFEKTIIWALDTAKPGKFLTPKEDLGFEIFGASFFESSLPARFLTLVMATEALIAEEPLSDEVRKVLDEMIATLRSAGLPPPETDSLSSRLGLLKKESISRAGRRLVKRHLAGSNYMEMSAPSFFDHVYNLRSELLHEGRVVSEDVNLSQTIAATESFVKDLLFAVAGVDPTVDVS